jgi:hypothetical protein
LYGQPPPLATPPQPSPLYGQPPPLATPPQPPPLYDCTIQVANATTVTATSYILDMNMMTVNGLTVNGQQYPISGIGPRNVLVPANDVITWHSSYSSSFVLCGDGVFVACSPGSTCPAGVTCRAATDCTRCPAGTVSSGGTCSECTDQGKIANAAQSACEFCKAGTKPNAARSKCRSCTGDTYSQFGVQCLNCTDGIVDATKTTCTLCPDGLRPNTLGSACICQHGRFNRSKDAQCYENDYSPPASFVRECIPCEELNLLGSGECVQAEQCSDADFHVRPGWLQLIREDGVRSSIFRCKHENACLDNRCNPGNTGPLCGVCEADYRRDSSGQCSACGTSTWAGVAILALILIILGLVVIILGLTVDRWGQHLVTVQALSDYLVELQLKAVAKIFVATMQILTAFTDVLNVEMPFDFQSLLQLLAIFRFDLLSILGLGCLMEDSYANSLATNFGLVVTMVLMSVGIAILERYKEPSKSKLQTFFDAADTANMDGTGLTLEEIVAVIHQVDDAVEPGRVKGMFMEADADSSERLSFDEFYAAYTQESGLGGLLRRAQRKRSFNDSLGRMFLLVFLVYPGLTSKIFDIFLCRDLGPGATPQSVLHADYGVDCDDTSVVRNGMGVLLVGIWPIGVPAALLISMLQYREAIVAQDEAALRMFQFVIADYKLEYWYWEVVELARKLLLSGLIVVLGRGTVAQAAAALMISCFFLVLSAKVEPFKSRALNAIKTVSEVQLFMVLLVCVILQTRGNNLDAEWITVEGYGVIQTVATLAILPITMGFIVYNVRMLQMDLKRARTDDPKATTDSEGDTRMKWHNPLDTDDDGDLQEMETVSHSSAASGSNASLDALLTATSLNHVAAAIVDLGVAEFADFADVTDEDLQECGLKKIEIKRLRRHLAGVLE